MPLNQTFKKSEKFIIPQDTHLAKIQSIIDIGLQDTGFKDITKEGVETGQNKLSNQVIVTLEFQDLLLPDGRPAVLSQIMTASLNEKSKFYKLAVAALGSSEQSIKYIETDGRTVEDVAKEILTKPVFVTIVHKNTKGKIFANVEAVSSIPSSMKKLVTDLVNPPKLISDCTTLNIEELASLPEFIRKKINSSLENSSLDT